MTAAGNLNVLGVSTLHVAVDMQRLFAEATEWAVPTFAAVVPPILELASAHPRRTLFTRFVTPANAESAAGDWRRFYARWQSVVAGRIDAAMFNVTEPLAGLVPPAEVIDKPTYSAFESVAFVESLARRRVETVVLSGVETDVCVLATALDAVDRGLHVVLAVDAVTSGSLAGHRAALDAIYPRFDQQIDLATVRDIIAAWPAD